MQPWIKLSQEHQTVWDASLRDCMITLTTILHQHHTEQLKRVEEQISSVSTTIHNQYPTKVSITILDIATSHKQRHNHKTRSKPKRSTKPTTRPYPINRPPHNLQQQKTNSPHLLTNHQENDRNPHNTRVFGQGHCIPAIQVITDPIHHHQPPHHQHYYHHHCPT